MRKAAALGPRSLTVRGGYRDTMAQSFGDSPTARTPPPVSSSLDNTRSGVTSGSAIPCQIASGTSWSTCVSEQLRVAT